MVVPTPPAMTADDFFKPHGHESNVELVRGQVVRDPLSGAGYGRVRTTAGVAINQSVILDPPTESASAFRPGTRRETFEKDHTLTLPDVLPGFEVPVARFFEE
jgi:Uma2 family endonuclease